MGWLLFPLAGVVAFVMTLGGGATAATPRTVGVTLADSRLTADVRTVSAGEVTFKARNAGSTDHELLVIRTELGADRLGPPARRRFAGLYVVGAPHIHGEETPGLRSRHVTPGRTRTDRVTLKPGRYVLFCGLPGHYESGQRTELRVTN